MERQLVELLSGLVKTESVNVELVLLSEEVHYSKLYDLNIPVYHVHRRCKKDPSVFWRLYRLFKDTKPNIIHVWESMNAVYALPGSFFLGIPYVNGMIRSAPDNLDFKNLIRARCTFWFSRKVISNSLAGLKAYKVRDDKAVCIYNGFDFGRMKNVEDSELLRAKLGLSADLVIGMVATFSENKDHRTIISAAHSILRLRNDVTFVFVGDGLTLNDCKRMIDERFRNKIRFLGRRNDIESLVNIFDIGVLSTYTEGISNSIMEYMAFEKPVVATDGGGTAELVTDKETGFLVKTQDPQDMVNKIMLLAEDKDLRIAMGKAGRRRLEKKFDYKSMIDNYISLYTSIASVSAQGNKS
ncbi:MAG: glycosyltransferase [Bacteroidales bacterium]|nr:glycosyltransferase [Bacteroidales bacterium]